MITPIQQKIRDKTITALKWSAMVKDGDWILPGTVGGDSTACVEKLGPRLDEGPGQVKGIELWPQVRPAPMYNILEQGEDEYKYLTPQV